MVARSERCTSVSNAKPSRDWTSKWILNQPFTTEQLALRITQAVVEVMRDGRDEPHSKCFKDTRPEFGGDVSSRAGPDVNVCAECRESIA